MTDNKLIEDFWRSCDMTNFSKEATVLFFYLLSQFKQSKKTTIYLHPASMLCKIVGFNPAAVTAASTELQSRGYVEYTPPEGNCTSAKYIIKNLDAIIRKPKQ